MQCTCSSKPGSVKLSFVARHNCLVCSAYEWTCQHPYNISVHTYTWTHTWTHVHTHMNTHIPTHMHPHVYVTAGTLGTAWTVSQDSGTPLPLAYLQGCWSLWCSSTLNKDSTALCGPSLLWTDWAAGFLSPLYAVRPNWAGFPYCCKTTLLIESCQQTWEWKHEMGSTQTSHTHTQSDQRIYNTEVAAIINTLVLQLFFFFFET